jgi:hypothetical protein
MTGPARTNTTTAAEVGEPCRCHKNFAAIAPMHPGHCCFQPATQTCHEAEVAAWEAENARRWPRRTVTDWTPAEEPSDD